MSTPTVASATAIRPFSVNFPDDALADRGRLIAATRWPTLDLVPIARRARSWGRTSHFAAWAEPEQLSAELRAAFSSLR